MPVLGALLLALVLISGDQLVKHWVIAHIAVGASQPVGGGVLALTNLHNDGAAWSLLAGQQWLFTVITVLALLAEGYFLWRWRHQSPLVWPLALIIAGTVGNFIDRLQNGYVVDMFELLFVNFPIFNVADCCLTVGVIWLMVIIIREEEE